MLTVAGIAPAKSKTSGKSLVRQYNAAHKALFDKINTAKRFCTSNSNFAFDFTDIQLPPKDGQYETLFTLAAKAALPIQSPFPNSGTVHPTDILKSLYQLLKPEKSAFHAITWLEPDSDTWPARVVLDHQTGKLWQCDLRAWKVHGEEVSKVPGQFDSPKAEWKQSGVYFQLQPFNGKSCTRDDANCIKTELEVFVTECDTEVQAVRDAWSRLVSLIPFPAFSIVETGQRCPHTVFVIKPEDKKALKESLGMMLKFLGNDHSGWNKCKVTRLGNCWRGKTGKLQTMTWYSPTPSSLNPNCQAQSVKEFAQLLYEAAEENEAAIEADIAAMQVAHTVLTARLNAANDKLPAIAKKTALYKSGAKDSGATKGNSSPDMEARMDVGGQVMIEIRKKLSHLLKKVPKDGKLDISKIPKSLVATLAKKHVIGETPEINHREIERCVRNVCDDPHRAIGTGKKSSFVNLGDEEFEAPLNDPYLGDRWAPKSGWWDKKLTDGLFNDLAFTARIINSATAKNTTTRELVPRVNALPDDRKQNEWVKHRETFGAEANSAEVLSFLKAFHLSKPKQLTVLGLDSDPAERIIAAAKLAFKEKAKAGWRKQKNYKRNNDEADDAPTRVEIFTKKMRQFRATDSELDALLEEIKLRLDVVKWDMWLWIEEDLIRLEIKFWDWSKVAKCGAAAKAIIREAVEAIVRERSAKKHRSPFVFPEDIYLKLATNEKLAKLESTMPGGLGETPKAKCERIREGAIQKIRRGLREMEDITAVVRTQGHFAKFRLVGLGLNNSNRSISKGRKGLYPSNKASDKALGVSSLDTPEVIAPSVADIKASHTAIDTELGLTGEKSEKKTKTAINKAGQATYTLKIDHANGDVLLGKEAKGKNSHKIIGSFKQRMVNAVFQGEEIAVIIKSINRSNYDDKVLISGLVAVDEQTASKIPATDIVTASAGTNYLYVEFYIKPPKGMKVENEADLCLKTDANLQVLRVFGHKVSPRAGNAAYCFLDSSLESIESVEAGTMLSHWDFETAQKLWKFKDCQAKKAKRSLVTA